MSYYLRLMGGGLILLLSMIVGSGYSAYKDRRITESEGFIALISHIEGMISRFLSHGSSLWQGFSNGELETCGFLPMLRNGASPAEAFSDSRSRLAISKKAKEKLSEYFGAFGRGYREDEVKKASACRSELEEMLRTERAELENNVKAVKAVLFGTALGVIILLI